MLRLPRKERKHLLSPILWRLIRLAGKWNTPRKIFKRVKDKGARAREINKNGRRKEWCTRVWINGVLPRCYEPLFPFAGAAECILRTNDANESSLLTRERARTLQVLEQLLKGTRYLHGRQCCRRKRTVRRKKGSGKITSRCFAFSFSFRLVETRWDVWIHLFVRREKPRSWSVYRISDAFYWT